MRRPSTPRRPTTRSSRPPALAPSTSCSRSCAGTTSRATPPSTPRGPSAARCTASSRSRQAAGSACRSTSTRASTGWWPPSPAACATGRRLLRCDDADREDRDPDEDRERDDRQRGVGGRGAGAAVAAAVLRARGADDDEREADRHGDRRQRGGPRELEELPDVDRGERHCAGTSRRWAIRRANTATRRPSSAIATTRGPAAPEPNSEVIAYTSPPMTAA